jgi:hypothetical protein
MSESTMLRLLKRKGADARLQRLQRASVSAGEYALASRRK